MRKLLYERPIFCKMSNIKIKENNRLFSKAENDSFGARERSAGNSRNSGVPVVQKRRDNNEGKHKGSIDANKSVKQNVNGVIESNKGKTHSSVRNMRRENDNRARACSSQFPDYAYCNGQHKQQMFPSHFPNNGFNVASNFVLNPFSRSLSESAVPCQQLSALYFNSYRDGNDASRRTTHKAMSHDTLANNVRAWQLTKLGKALKKMNGGKNSGTNFKVMTYNVLAQDLLLEHPELYRENDVKTLNWEVRWRNIFQDIKKHDCDIVCLQEVQHDHLQGYYDSLKGLGYKGVYKQRTGIRTDGCALYYKSSVFKLVEYTAVEYRQANVPILDRDNVGIIATFAPVANPTAQFIVATTHLLYNPRRHDVRLAQVQVLLTEVERMAYRHNKSGLKYIPVIVTGDLNAEPQSPVYDFIARGKLKYENTSLRSNYVAGKSLIPSSLMITDNCQHASLLKIRSKNRTISREDEKKYIQISTDVKKESVFDNSTEHLQYKFNSGVLTHNFVFKSVYKHLVDGDLEGTTYQNAWVTVDYIFYSGLLDQSKSFKDGKLKLLSRYTLPTSNQLAHVRIPNKYEGSDHLALLASFKLEY